MRYAPPPSGCSVFLAVPMNVAYPSGVAGCRPSATLSTTFLIDLLSGHRADDSPSFKSHNRDGVTQPPHRARPAMRMVGCAPGNGQSCNCGSATNMGK